MFTFVLLMCVALFGAGSTEGTFTKQNLLDAIGSWLKDFCNNLNEKLIDALQACTKTNAVEYNEALKSCMETTGKSSASYYEYIKAGCETKELAENFLKCMGDKATEELVEKADKHDETEACFNKTFIDMGVPRVEGIFFKRTG